jgi:intein/homing endonuclease
MVASSISLVDFMIQKGAVRGNKINQGLDIPSWLRGNREYEKAFVRGLVDTDGCLYIHRHSIQGIQYKNIGFCFTSGSHNLLYSVADIFYKFGISPHIEQKGTRIYLYRKDSVVRYLSIFGSANPRISGVYKNWKGA